MKTPLRLRSFAAISLRLAAAALLLVMGGLAGCRSRLPPLAPAGLEGEPGFVLTPRPELPPGSLLPPDEPYRLGIGDLVEIEISETPGTRATTFIMTDGRLYYDLAGGVRADGLTIAELSARLEEALRRDYHEPHVNVTLLEVRSRRFWILGRVFNPGLYPLREPTTLVEAISMAGGLFTSRFSGTTEELADLSHSLVIRGGEVLPVDFEALLRRGDMSQNIYLRPDDYVFLPSSLSQNVYVLGSVRQPKAVGFRDRLSVVGALAHAKGPLPEAWLKGVVVLRGSLRQPRAASVDVAAILAGRARDVNLEPGDVVWVPDSPLDRWDKYFWSILNTAARTIAVNEGTRAAAGSAAPSVTIPVGGTP